MTGQNSEPQNQSQPARPNDMMLRLQIGIGGVVAVLLLVGLAEIISSRAVDRASETATTAPTKAGASDQPLVDLGVQPATPDPAATPTVAAPAQATGAVTDLPAAPPVDPASAPRQ